jgi:hypothetical protein
VTAEAGEGRTATFASADAKQQRVAGTGRGGFAVRWGGGGWRGGRGWKRAGVATLAGPACQRPSSADTGAHVLINGTVGIRKFSRRVDELFTRVCWKPV